MCVSVCVYVCVSVCVCVCVCVCVRVCGCKHTHKAAVPRPHPPDSGSSAHPLLRVLRVRHEPQGLLGVWQHVLVHGGEGAFPAWWALVRPHRLLTPPAMGSATFTSAGSTVLGSRIGLPRPLPGRPTAPSTGSGGTWGDVAAPAAPAAGAAATTAAATADAAAIAVAVVVAVTPATVGVAVDASSVRGG